MIVDASVNNRVSLGDAAVAIVGLQQLSGRVRTASTSWGSLHHSAASSTIFSICRFARAAQEESVDGGARATFHSSRGERVVPLPGHGCTVLDNVSSSIHRGEVVAIVGVSGRQDDTGALIAGLYRPTNGRVTWNGADVRDTHLATYWRSLAVVFQDFVRYELSAREKHHQVTTPDSTTFAQRVRPLSARESRQPSRPCLPATSRC